jgi:hypothetical protein
VLRAWFSKKMGVSVADRLIDVFRHRAQRTVLTEHHTGKELQLLKRIYEKVNLKVLS